MRIPLLALSLALFSIPAVAQFNGGNHTFKDPDAPSWDPWSWPTNSHGPTDPLTPAASPNSSFPLQVKLMLHDNHFNYFWSDFRGHGQLLAGNTLYNFRYECPDTFRQPSAFQARWSRDGKKLDVLLQKSGSNHTEVCTLNILNRT